MSNFKPGDRVFRLTEGVEDWGVLKNGVYTVDARTFGEVLYLEGKGEHTFDMRQFGLVIEDEPEESEDVKNSDGRGPGVWVGITVDPDTFVIYEDEIDALRFAVSEGGVVHYIEYGTGVVFDGS